jgi:hypothetical protein
MSFENSDSLAQVALDELPIAGASGEQIDAEDTAAKKAVLLRLTIRSWGVRRTVSTTKVEVNADKSLIFVGKNILDSETLRKIRSLDGDIRAYLASKALPSQFKSGVYLVPIKLVTRIDAVLQRKIALRRELVAQLSVELPGLIEEIKPRLKEVFNQFEYPTPEQILALFNLTYSYFTFDSPESLRAISTEIFEREAESAKEWWVAAKAGADDLLMEQAQEITDHLLKRLSAETEGDRLKGLRNSAVNALTEFFDDFDDRNLGNNAALTEIVTRGKALLSGVDTNTLRNNLGRRETVKSGLADIKEQLDKLVMDRPKRRIVLSDDDV